MHRLAHDIIRGAQLLLGIIVLGLSADAVTRLAYPQAAFNVFVSIWTVLVALYFILTPRFLEAAYHPYARVGVDALTMLFWFAGFIAIAQVASVAANGFYSYDYYFGGSIFYDGRFYKEAAAAAGLGGLEWILFVVTTVFTCLEVFRKGGATTTHRQADPMNPEVQV